MNNKKVIVDEYIANIIEVVGDMKAQGMTAGELLLTTSVTELKVELPVPFTAAENETFYNMFGEAVRLTFESLSRDL